MKSLLNSKNHVFTGLAFIYFFINSWLLPEGLTFLIILTPILYLWLYKRIKANILGYFGIAFLCFYAIHSVIGINHYYYWKTGFLALCIYIQVFAFYIYLKNSDISKVFGQILWVNLLLTLVALIIFFTPFKGIFWHTEKLTIEILDVSRLRLLTYEPSYYALLLVPIALYYLIGSIYKRYQPSKIVFILLALALPFTFSFSLGVLAVLFMSLVITLIMYLGHLLRNRLSLYSLTFFSGILLIGCILVIVFYPDNLLFLRIEDLIEGKDTSGKGRTTEAIKLAFQMAELKSYWLGCGLGQIKILGEDVVRTYYKYQLSDIPIIRIPSSIGETISTFGLIGLIIRLFVQVYLFFKTKVYINMYRFSMFIFIFIYQFTGSFITNIAEYVIWVIAFTPGFYDFDTIKRSKS